jgi:hypothetical protein
LTTLQDLHLLVYSLGIKGELNQVSGLGKTQKGFQNENSSNLNRCIDFNFGEFALSTPLERFWHS